MSSDRDNIAKNMNNGIQVRLIHVLSLMTEERGGVKGKLLYASGIEGVDDAELLS